MKPERYRVLIKNDDNGFTEVAEFYALPYSAANISFAFTKEFGEQTYIATDDGTMYYAHYKRGMRKPELANAVITYERHRNAGIFDVPV